METQDYKMSFSALKEKYEEKKSAKFIGKKIIEKIGKERDFFSMSIDEVFEKANDVINEIRIELNKNDNATEHKK